MGIGWWVCAIKLGYKKLEDIDDEHIRKLVKHYLNKKERETT